MQDDQSTEEDYIAMTKFLSDHCDLHISTKGYEGMMEGVKKANERMNELGNWEEYFDEQRLVNQNESQRIYDQQCYLASMYD